MDQLREDIREYVVFEDCTSDNYPWRLSAFTIVSKYLDEIAGRVLAASCDGTWDTSLIHQCVCQVCG